MKILHTADWHIGKVLHKYSLSEEMQAFFDWLIITIKEENIDLLLISGDVFDLSNPTIKDKEAYYKMVMRLYETGCQVIITGGNHDSVGELNAPKEILSAINISVIGGAMSDPEDEIIEIKDAAGEIVLVVAATPFLRDRDLRKKQEDETYENRAEAIREGIKSHYATLGDICSTKYPRIPAIAMGHLYATGAKSSESERDIHVGNQAAVDSQIFPNNFQYVALGHIHMPQMVQSNPKIQYSGSPIALSFSEKEDHKIVLIIEVQDKVIESITPLEIPKNREIRKFTGNYEEVAEALDSYKPEYRFPSLVELEIVEKAYSNLMLSKVEDLVDLYKDKEHYRILKHKTLFENAAQDTASLFTEGTNIEDLKPIDVFHKKLDAEDIEEDTRALLSAAFVELLEDSQQ